MLDVYQNIPLNIHNLSWIVSKNSMSERLSLWVSHFVINININSLGTNSEDPEASHEVDWGWGGALPPLLSAILMQPIKPEHARPRGSDPASAAGNQG